MLSNPRSERVRAVRALTGRSVRERRGCFAVEGPQAVREALAAHGEQVAAGGRAVVRELYLTEGAAARHPELPAAAERGGVRWTAVSEPVLAAMTDTVTPQGVVAVCSLVAVPLAEALPAGAAPRLVAVLARVQDPGNAGTVIRVADAAGADLVVLTESSVDPHNPKCVRATVGSLFHLPVVTGPTVAATVTALRAVGLRICAADGRGPWDLDDLIDAARGPASAFAGQGPPALAEPVAWLFGNEARGLTDAERDAADAVVRVPLHGRAESLNLATAAAVCLYGTAHCQRRPRT